MAGTSLVYPYVSITCPDVDLEGSSNSLLGSAPKITTIQYAVYGNSSGAMKFIGMTSPVPITPLPKYFPSKQNGIKDWGPSLSIGTMPPTGIPLEPPIDPVNQIYQGQSRFGRRHARASHISADQLGRYREGCLPRRWTRAIGRRSSC